jgi:RHS repeat-associated protein
MDSLTYHYYANTNQLQRINDSAGGSYTADLKDQGSGNNYTYDLNGQLTQDVGNGVSAIGWTVYGKIDTLVNSSGTIVYTYDAAGNRITKSSGGTSSIYVRDAQGNILAIYTQAGSGAPLQAEVDLYGSSRLGALGALTVAPTKIALAGGYDTAYLNTFSRGEKSYELTNHLGNVLSTITDKKNAVSSISDSSLIDHFTADIATVQDYYPFGMLMPGRSFTAAGAGNYRWGFNGKENDNEVKGAGNQIDYGMRYFDPRAGRFLSTDPLQKGFPQLSAYQYSGNNPIKFVDLDGTERYDPNIKPHGITLVEKATVPGGNYATKTLKAGNYDLVGVSNKEGNSYWIARLTFKSGDRQGMYRDDYIVGTDGVFDFIKNAKQYEWRANMLEFARSLDPEAGTGSVGVDYLHMWTRQASNPMTWLNAGAATLSSMPSPSRSLGQVTLDAELGFENDIAVFPSLSKRIPYEMTPNDLDWRGTNKTFSEALDEAFKRTGMNKSEYTPEKWAPTQYGKQIPVEYKGPGGAEVSVDFAHTSNGPEAPHIGWQSPGKGANQQSGHILLDEVPAGRSTNKLDKSQY